MDARARRLAADIDRIYRKIETRRWLRRAVIAAALGAGIGVGIMLMVPWDRLIVLVIY